MGLKRNPNTGELRYGQKIAVAAALSGPRGLTVSPDGANLYGTG